MGYAFSFPKSLRFPVYTDTENALAGGGKRTPPLAQRWRHFLHRGQARELPERPPITLRPEVRVPPTNGARVAAALRGFPRLVDPPPGRDGAGPGSGAPAQLTRLLSPCWLLPRRAGPGSRHVRPVGALGAGPQRPALGRQWLLQPSEPALQRGYPQDLRGQRVSPRSRAPGSPFHPRSVPPTLKLGWGRRQARVRAWRWSSVRDTAGWAGAGVAYHPPRVGLGGWMSPRPVGSFPSRGVRARGPLGPASVLPGAATR